MRRLTLTLVGEPLREVAVLIVVFLPLDLFAKGKLLTARFLISTIVSVGLVFGLGVFLEVKSRWIR